MAKILCILQNAWGSKCPVTFRPNPRNKSAKTIKKMVGDIPYDFSNTTDECTPTAKGKAKPNPVHFKKVIERIPNYDLVLVCGNQVKETVRKHIGAIAPLGVPVVYVPHPASRTLSNATCAEIKTKVEEILKKN